MDLLQTNIMPNSADNYKYVPIENVIPNNWNPNTMSNEKFILLKTAIDKNKGNNDLPILVRPIWLEKLEIVDWFHRYQAMLQLWYKEILVFEQYYSDADARLETISMNSIKGDFDTIKLSFLLKELRDVYNVDIPTIEEITWLTRDAIEGIEKLLVEDTWWLTITKDSKEKKKSLHTIHIELSDEQLQNIKSLSDFANANDAKDAIMWALLFMLNNLQKSEAPLYR